MYKTGDITHTIKMVFKDATGSQRTISVPNARTSVTKQDVRRVMDFIVKTGIFLSRKGLPLVKIVRATLVTVRWIFVAEREKKKSGPAPAAQVPSNGGISNAHAAESEGITAPTTAAAVPRPRLGRNKNKVQTAALEKFPLFFSCFPVRTVQHLHAKFSMMVLRSFRLSYIV